MSTLVIADTVAHARAFAKSIIGPTIAASPRSILIYHAIRGRILTGVVVHGSAWPLDDAVRAELDPAIAHLSTVPRLASGE